MFFINNKMVSCLEDFHHTMDILNFSYFERHDLTLKKLLGSGYIGEVYQGSINIMDDTIPCVIKKVSSKSYDLGKDDSYFYEDIIHEVNIFHEFSTKQANHQIQFYGYSTQVKNENVDLYILMEQTEARGDIQKYIYDDEFWVRLTKEEYDSSNSNTTLSHEDSYYDYIMSQKDKLNLCYQISLAVKELHSFQIVHTDIKPHNMLYTDNKVKLIDFNASVKLSNNCEIVRGKREQGTPGYMAKEMYKGDISYQADIYALGVTMLEVWFGDIWPHQTDRYDKNRRYVLDYLSLLEDDHPQLHQLIKQCVSVKREKRPSIEMVVDTLTTMVTL